MWRSIMSWMHWIHVCVDESIRDCQRCEVLSGRRPLPPGTGWQRNGAGTNRDVALHQQAPWAPFVCCFGGSTNLLFLDFHVWHMTSLVMWQCLEDISRSWCRFFPCWNGTEEHNEPCIETILWTKNRHDVSCHLTGRLAKVLQAQGKTMEAEELQERMNLGSSPTPPPWSQFEKSLDNRKLQRSARKHS